MNRRGLIKHTCFTNANPRLVSEGEKDSRIGKGERNPSSGFWSPRASEEQFHRCNVKLKKKREKAKKKLRVREREKESRFETDLTECKLNFWKKVTKTTENSHTAYKVCCT